MKRTITLFLVLFSFAIQAQDYITFNDPDLKTAILAHSGDIDANSDGEIQFTEAEDFTDAFYLGHSNIDDATGLEYFVNITELRIEFNSLTALDLTANDKLVMLYANNNDLTSINITGLSDLELFSLGGNSLTTIDFSTNTSLTTIAVINNSLNALNIDNQILLETLYCTNNALDELDLSNNLNLVQLYCGGNILTDLILGSPNLITLHCENNQLTNDSFSFSGSGTSILQHFIANDNLLYGELRLLVYPNLKSLNLANNPSVEKIDIRNGNNVAITLFDATGCTALTTVCVDDATAAPTATGWSVDDSSVYSTCLIEIPDSDFEQALIDLGIDTNHADGDVAPYSPNGYIYDLNTMGVTYLPLSNKSISNLTGINYFTDLEALIANNNQLSGIDVNNLSNLITLNLKNNNLDSYYMTLPNPSSLKNLYVDNNQEFYGGNHFNNVIANQANLERLTLADNNAQFIELTDFPNLLEFDCSNNPAIDELDVSNSPQLRILKAANCSISTLNVSSVHSLDEIQVPNNGMTVLMIGNQPHMNSLRCFNNSLTVLVVSGVPHLGFLNCADNQLTALDISNNHQLGYLGTSNNNTMITLNLNNGNNATTLTEVYATNLGSGCCIQVDDETAVPAAWSLDTTDTTITNDCTPDLTYVPDDNFEQALIDLGYDDVLDDHVLTTNINTIISLSVHEKNIADLTGIEDFVALEYLYVNNNDLASIDLFYNTSLTTLSCSYNSLTSLDLSNNVLLTSLSCSANQIISLDLSLNDQLTHVYCPGNALQEFNIQNGNNTSIAGFNTYTNPDLFCITVDDAAYSTSNWTNIDAASTFVETEAECDAILDVSHEAFEKTINLYPNPVTSLLTIQVNNDIQLEKVRLFDSMGKQISIIKNSDTISFGNLPSGVYFIKLQDVDGNSITKKVIKM